MPILVDGQVIGGIGVSFDTPEHDVANRSGGTGCAQPLIKDGERDTAGAHRGKLRFVRVRAAFRLKYPRGPSKSHRNGRRA
jgi:hypothetical protein